MRGVVVEWLWGELFGLGEGVRVCLVRCGRARRYVVRVVGVGVVRVTVPRGGSRVGALGFLEGHVGWVLERLEAVRLLEVRRGAAVVVGSGFWYRGVVEVVGVLGRVDGGGLVVGFGDVRVVVGGGVGCLRGVLEGVLRGRARGELGVCLGVWARRMGVCPGRVCVRGQRGVWGSCSSLGTVSLNWRLVQVPLVVRDYVLVHELAHLRFLNHSRGFWDFVEGFCPDFRRYEGWLRGHGEILSGAAPVGVGG